MAAPPTRPRLRARYDRRQKQVVGVAACLIAKRGYHGTSMEELSNALELTQGTLYHYINSKPDLLALICDELMEPLLERAECLLAQDIPPEAQLRALLRLWVDHVASHRDHMLVFQQERHVLESG